MPEPRCEDLQQAAHIAQHHARYVDQQRQRGKATQASVDKLRALANRLYAASERDA